MSKKKKVIILLAVLSCILLTFLGGQSYSKYISEIRGTGTADIAKWNFKVNGSTEEIQSIKLVPTIYNVATLVKNKIAPGTKGSFDITVDATDAEVRVGYNIKFQNETTKPTNLKFKYRNQTYDNLSEIEEFLSGHFSTDDRDHQLTFTIGWEWPFETGSTPEEKAANNKIDTQEAQSITDYSFDVVVTGTQMMPE